MKTSKMPTRKDETIITTTDPSEMLGKYLVNPIFRKWYEPFIDDDSGELIEVERHEIVLERGTYLDGEQIAVINFHMQTDDLTEVKVSNQKRIGKFATGFGVHPWCVTVLLHKKHKYLCLARNIWQAIEIVEDYCEQKFDIVFDIVSAKEFKQHIFIFDDTVRMVEDNGQIKTQTEVDEDRGIVYVFYSVEVQAKYSDDSASDYRYLVYAKDVDDAKVLIEKDVRKRAEQEASIYGSEFCADRADGDIEIIVKQAKQVNCAGVIGLEFTEAYCRDKEEE